MSDNAPKPNRTYQLALSGSDIAILGACIRCCIGWREAAELQRFVNIAGEHLGWQGFTDDEMNATHEALCGAFYDARAESEDL